MRTTSTFRELGPGLYCVDCDAFDRGLHVPLRMPIIRANDGLLLYSPVPIDDEIASQIAALGEVAHVVAPNLNHDKFLRRAAERYPQARRWGAPGLAERRPDLRMESGLPDPGLPMIALEGVPFTNELVLFDAPSRSLICADLVQNMHDEASLLTRLLLRGMGSWRVFGPNRYWKWQTRDRAAFARSIERVLDWEPERVVMSHGEVLDSGGAPALREAMVWAIS